MAGVASSWSGLEGEGEGKRKMGKEKKINEGVSFGCRNEKGIA